MASRVRTPSVDAATGMAAEVFSQLKKSVGKVPNTFASIGAHDPAALKAMLQVEAVLAAGPLDKQDLEAIKLTVSAAVGCDYCEAAHTVLGKLAGLKPDELRQIRAGETTGNPKRDALVNFVRMLVQSNGTVSDSDFAAIKAAGYTEAQLVGISLALAAITFTNVFNRINDTTLDFPAAA